MKKVSFTVMLLLSLSGSFVHAQKIAYILTDPSLGYMGEYWNTDRYKYERAYYAYNGYQVVEVKATEENLIRAIIDRNVKAITYIGHGGAEDSQGNVLPTLGDSHGNYITATEWKGTIYRELYMQYRRQGISKEESRKKATGRARNFGKERVVNYSCNSLINHDIADQFVKPGGTYYGSKKLYNPKAFSESLLYIYTLLTGNNKDSQFFLNEYTVPSPPVKVDNRNSFSALMDELTTPEHLEAMSFNNIFNAANSASSSSTCPKFNPSGNRGGKHLAAKSANQTYVVCSYSKYGCLVKEEPKVNGKYHGIIKTWNSPRNCSDSFLVNTLEIDNGRINGMEHSYSRTSSGSIYKLSSMPYKDGKRHGTYVRWREDGKKMSATTYVQGKDVAGVSYNEKGIPYHCTKRDANGTNHSYPCNSSVKP